MSGLAVSTGQQVIKGEIIGFVGSSGYSTGPHLHYEVIVDGQNVDPFYVLKSTK
ncbi:MAG: M23 family metallopeptidase [Phascolarctobacterium sp.]|nr:M23 family metallopeptidase [Phascolarctobacterium sp.]